MTSTLTLEGELTRVTYNDQLQRVLSAIESGISHIDLSSVAPVDSASVALWVAVQRVNPSIGWLGFPEQMLSIAELVGVDIT